MYKTTSLQSYHYSVQLSLLLFLIAMIGFILNRKSLIMLLIAVEILLLAVTLHILLNGYSYDDSIAQAYGIYIIAIAAAESAIGLGVLVAYYRLRGSLALTTQ